MAAEAGISSEALAKALRHSRDRNTSAAGRPAPGWRRKFAWIVPTGLVVVALFGLMIAVPVVAEVLFWAIMITIVLVLLGAAPF